MRPRGPNPHRTTAKDYTATPHEPRQQRLSICWPTGPALFSVCFVFVFVRVFVCVSVRMFVRCRNDARVRALATRLSTAFPQPLDTAFCHTQCTACTKRRVRHLRRFPNISSVSSPLSDSVIVVRPVPLQPEPSHV